MIVKLSVEGNPTRVSLGNGRGDDGVLAEEDSEGLFRLDTLEGIRIRVLVGSPCRWGRTCELMTAETREKFGSVGGWTEDRLSL